MTTNTEHRRRETDKIDQVCIKYQIEKANARIAELEVLLKKVSMAAHDIDWDKRTEQLDNVCFEIDKAIEFKFQTPPAEKQVEPTACRICHGSLDKHGTCIDPECIPY